VKVIVKKSVVRTDERSFGMCVVCRSARSVVGEGAYRLTTTSSGHTWFTHPYCFVLPEQETEYVQTQDVYHGVQRA
jgi:hypothetical protein